MELEADVTALAQRNAGYRATLESEMCHKINSGIVLLPLSLFGEDITTRNGKVYKDVQIFKQEADRLVITYPRGAAAIYLEDCREDTRKKYNYYCGGIHDDTAATIMTLHEAVPAKGVLKLIDRMNADAAGTR